MDSLAKIDLSRRSLLAGGLCAGAMAAFPAIARPGENFFTRNRFPIGVQLYPLSADVRADIRGTFAKLARLGYQSLETAGFAGHNAAEMKAAADEAGLTIGSAHIASQWALNPGDHLLTAPDMGPVIADLKLMGVHTAVMPMPLLPAEALPVPGQRADRQKIRAALAAYTADDWKRTADFLNRRAVEFKQAGIGFCYHNHNFEFAPIGNTTGWDILLRETDPSLVHFEMDVGWVAAAGRDPLAVLARQKDRVRMLHVKDIDAKTVPNFAMEQISAAVGKGKTDWPRLLQIARKRGVTGYYVEQEPPFPNGPLPAMEESITYLKSLR